LQKLKTIIPGVNTNSVSLFLEGIMNSYSQIFFSTDKLFAFLILAVSFIDLYAGLFGLLAVLTTLTCAYILDLDKQVISKGLYGFNSLLVSLGLGIYYHAGIHLVIIVMLSAVLTLFISIMLQGVLGKYGLPYLSLPFILAFWTFFLATQNFPALGISERGIYTFNDLYTIGGNTLVNMYENFNRLNIVYSLKVYFISLSAILFQYNVLTGIILATGLLIFSRIAFSLSMLGFYTAFLFYQLVGANITEADYSYIGFNYILTAIAAGGFFIVPSGRSYLWTILLIPLVAIITTSLNALFFVFRLPVYSLPFNIVVLVFLYILKFRQHYSDKLSEVYIQQNSPEKNLYAFKNHITRFRLDEYTPIYLPFMGKWNVSQSHEGEITHKDKWKYAWDFIILDQQGSQFKNEGNDTGDYYCFGKPVIAPADGVVEEVENDIDDNPLGEANIKDNWGNTLIIKHEDNIYSKLSHLKKGSITVKKEDKVKKGQVIAKCGNSGRSPYPHLHFQIQAYPYIGSETLYYPIADYISYSGNKPMFRAFDIPKKDEQVSNIEKTKLIENAIHLVPGQTLCYIPENGSENDKVFWEVKVNIYNKAYIHCKNSGAEAYFEQPDNIFTFTHYKGNRNTLLYNFYLALFKIQPGFYKGIDLQDEYPVNMAHNKLLIWIQDFFAPFFFFLKSKYYLSYDYIDDIMSPGQIRLGAVCENLMFGKIVNSTAFTVEISSRGIESLTITGKEESKKYILCEGTL